MSDPNRVNVSWQHQEKKLFLKEFISDYFVLAWIIIYSYSRKGLFDSEALLQPCQKSMTKIAKLPKTVKIPKIANILAFNYFPNKLSHRFDSCSTPVWFIVKYFRFKVGYIQKNLQKYKDWIWNTIKTWKFHHYWIPLWNSLIRWNTFFLGILLSKNITIVISNHLHGNTKCQCHCVKSVGIRRFSSPYSVRMWENKDQENYEYGHCSRSVWVINIKMILSGFTLKDKYFWDKKYS